MVEIWKRVQMRRAGKEKIEKEKEKERKKNKEIK